MARVLLVDLVAEGGNVEFIADLGGDLGGLLAVEVQDDNGPALAGVAAGGGDADPPVRGGPGEDAAGVGEPGGDLVEPPAALVVHLLPRQPPVHRAPCAP